MPSCIVSSVRDKQACWPHNMHVHRCTLFPSDNPLQIKLLIKLKLVVAGGDGAGICGGRPAAGERWRRHAGGRLAAAGRAGRARLADAARAAVFLVRLAGTGSSARAAFLLLQLVDM